MKKFNFKMKHLVIGIVALILVLVGVLAFQQNQLLKKEETQYLNALLSSKMTKEYESRIKDTSGNNGLDSTVTTVQAGDYVEGTLVGTIYDSRSPEGNTFKDEKIAQYISPIKSDEITSSNDIIRQATLGSTLNQNQVTYLEIPRTNGLSHFVFKPSKIYRLNQEEQDRIYKEAQAELPAYVDQARKDAKNSPKSNGLNT